FSSVLSYSQPNHWYEIAGQAPNVSLQHAVCGIVGPNVVSKNAEYCNGQVTTIGNTYLAQANNITTTADLLQAENVSWAYYSSFMPVATNGCFKQACAVVPVSTYANALSTGSAFDYWSPLRAQARTYNQSRIHSMRPSGQIFSDIKNNNLADITWISPPPALSDHPPANITIGSWYVADIVDSIMQSKYWSTTAIIIMEDDYGGSFDTVAPPQVDANGLSFRVPSIVISPYSKTNYVDHNTYCFESTMRFIENIYSLPSLTARDGPNSVCGNMLNSFNFNQTPNPPHVFPLNSIQLSVINSFLGPTTFSGSDEIGKMIANITQDPVMLSAFNDSTATDSTTNPLANMNYVGISNAPSTLFNIMSYANLGNTDNTSNYNISIPVGYNLVNGAVVPINVSEPASWFIT
ncbi:MAG: alkaline phosphatase family protein, partial [Candidatus Micrarchaeales archaeon]